MSDFQEWLQVSIPGSFPMALKLDFYFSSFYLFFSLFSLFYPILKVRFVIINSAKKPGEEWWCGSQVTVLQ